MPEAERLEALWGAVLVLADNQVLHPPLHAIAVSPTVTMVLPFASAPTLAQAPAKPEPLALLLTLCCALGLGGHRW